MEIKVSDRLLRLPPYLFGKLNSIKSELRREGRDIIDFGMGNPDKAAPPEVIAKTQEVMADPKAHRHSHPKRSKRNMPPPSLDRRFFLNCRVLTSYLMNRPEGDTRCKNGSCNRFERLHRETKDYQSK